MLLDQDISQLALTKIARLGRYFLPRSCYKAIHSGRLKVIEQTQSSRKILPRKCVGCIANPNRKGLPCLDLQSWNIHVTECANHHHYKAETIFEGSKCVRHFTISTLSRLVWLCSQSPRKDMELLHDGIFTASQFRTVGRHL